MDEQDKNDFLGKCRSGKCYSWLNASDLLEQKNILVFFSNLSKFEFIEIQEH